jgi:hypothetical protein
LAFLASAWFTGCLENLDKTEGSFPASFVPEPTALDSTLSFLPARRIPNPIYSSLQLQVAGNPGPLAEDSFHSSGSDGEGDWETASYVALYGFPNSTSVHDLAILVLQYAKPSYASQFLDGADCTLGDVWLRDGNVSVGVITSGTERGQAIGKKAVDWIEEHSGARRQCGEIGGEDPSDRDEEGRDFNLAQGKAGDGKWMRGFLKPKGDRDTSKIHVERPCWFYFQRGGNTGSILASVYGENGTPLKEDAYGWWLPEPGAYEFEIRSADPAIAPQYALMSKFASGRIARDPCFEGDVS